MGSWLKPGGTSSRYNSFDTTTRSSHQSSSSINEPAARRGRTPADHVPYQGGALVKVKSSEVAQVKSKKGQSLGAMTMVKKLLDISSSKPKEASLVIPPAEANLIAEDLKKKMSAIRKKESNFGQKLFSKGKRDGNERKALTEVKSNTRTLAMVLRSERELLTLNKDQQSHIADLQIMLDQRNKEVEKLKDLCLKQREEIRSLKSAVLFPETMNLKLEELLERQGSELNQAKKLIPSLQRQVTSLTGQLHSLAEDLAEVKADKYSSRSYEAHFSSPKTPTHDQQDATNSLEFSSGNQTSPGSPDDMFLKDFNPCLTPCYSKTKSKEFDELVYDSPPIKTFSRNNMQLRHEIGFDSHLKNLSRSSDCCKCSDSGSTSTRIGRSR